MTDTQILLPLPVQCNGPWERAAVHEVVDLMRVEELAEAVNEVHALLAAALHVHQNQQRSASLRYHPRLSTTRRHEMSLQLS